MKITDKQFDSLAIIMAILILVGMFFFTIRPEVSMEAKVLSSQACTSLNGLPDSKCTPGAINPDITQANIDKTICNKRWSTKSIRPPSSYTTNLKSKQMVDYNLVGSLRDYEEDHLISLELGGSPKDPKNLWPESYSGNYGAREKDKVENLLHREVCTGRMTLVSAQKAIATSWKTALSNPMVKGTLDVSPIQKEDQDDN